LGLWRLQVQGGKKGEKITSSKLAGLTDRGSAANALVVRLISERGELTEVWSGEIRLQK